MPQFTIKGTVDMGRTTQTFEHELEAASEQHAQQKVYAKYGSEHGANKSQISINTLEQT